MSTRHINWDYNRVCLVRGGQGCDFRWLTKDKTLMLLIRSTFEKFWIHRVPAWNCSILAQDPGGIVKSRKSLVGVESAKANGLIGFVENSESRIVWTTVVFTTFWLWPVNKYIPRQRDFVIGIVNGRIGTHQNILRHITIRTVGLFQRPLLLKYQDGRWGKQRREQLNSCH